MIARPTRLSLAVGALGIAVGLVQARFDPRGALFAYVAAVEATLAVALGALLFLVITQAAGARWFVPLRRVTSAIAATLPIFLVLFVPIALSVRELYPWAGHPADLDPAARAWAEHARAWLNVPFFVARAYVYLGTWSLLATLLRRATLANDARPSVALARRKRLLSAAAIPILAVTLTLASFDWIMSLDARWSSDMMGVYLFAGAFSGAIGVTAIAAWLAWRSGALPRGVGPAHFHALGRVLFVAVIFWAYIAFCQFLLVWIADMERESVFYVARARVGWAAIAALLAVVHFVVPFFLLLSRSLKRTPWLVAAVGACVVSGHALDAAWLVIPATHGGVSPLDVGFMIGLGGIGAAVALSRFLAAAEVPVHDPALAESLRYESP